MIDSITIKIEFGNGLKIKQRDLFMPELKKRKLKDLSETERKTIYKKGYLTKFRLVTPKEYGYMPRMKLFEKIDRETNKIIYDTKIEVSLPKLVYGNNLQELSENDLNLVCTRIMESFSKIGIFIKRDALINATVTKLDIGKNFILPDDIHPHEIINTIAKTGSTKVCDGVRERFSNDGSLARIRSGSREDVFYDKIKDMQKTKSKAYDKDGKDTERAFLEKYSLEKVNILRYEYRFIRVEPLKSDVNSYLKKEYVSKILLSDIFNDDLCKHLLRKAWNKIYNKPVNQTLFKTLDVEPIDILNHVIKVARKGSNTVHSQNIAYISYGLIMAIRDCGADMVHTACLDGWSEKTCGIRHTEKIQTAEKLLKGLPVLNSMSFIDTEIQSCQQLTLADFEKYRII